jgi:hypothetical protein
MSDEIETGGPAFMGDENTPPNFLNLPTDRDVLITSIWRAGFMAGRLAELRGMTAHIESADVADRNAKPEGEA